MPIPLEQTMCWDKSSQKNSANTPVLMMAAIARLTGSNPSLACVPLFGDGVSCGFPLTEDIETVVFGVVRHLVHSFKFRDA